MADSINAQTHNRNAKLWYAIVQNAQQSQVFLDEEVSRQRTLNDGLTQGAVLSCLLFLLYVGDVSDETSTKFIFADDFGLAVQSNTFMGEFQLTQDHDIMWKYFVK